MPGQDEIRVQDEQGNVHVFPGESTPEMIAKALNVKPPVAQTQSGGFWKALGSDVGGAALGVGDLMFHGLGNPGAMVEQAGHMAAGMAARQMEGRSVPYQVVAPIGEMAGVNVQGMENAAAKGDTGGVLGHAAAPLAMYGAARGIGAALPERPGALAPPTPPPGAEPTGFVRGQVRSYMGIGPRMAEKTATKAMEEHGEAVAEAGAKTEAAQAKFQARTAQIDRRQAAVNKATEEANKQALAEHQEHVARVDRINQAGEEQVGRKAELSGKIKTDSEHLGQQIKQVEQEARLVGRQRYAEVDKAIGGDTVTGENLAHAVNHAETQIIRGSSESIKQFRELLQKGQPGEVTTSMGVATPGTPLYESLVKTGAIDPAAKLGFRDLQGYYTELGQKMGQEGLPGDVYNALKYVRQQIGVEMQKMAENRGVGQQLMDAQQYWRKYENTFHDMRPIARGGSPIARSLRAVDPGYVAAPLLGKASARAVQMLREYSPEAANRAAQIAADDSQMRSLPSKFTPRLRPDQPVPQVARTLDKPQPPQPEQPPQAPDLGKTIQEAREKRIGSISSNLRSVSGWDLASLAGGGVELARGEVPVAFGLTVLRHGLGRLLDSPKVIDWLSRPTAEDFAQLSSLPGPQRIRVQEGVAQVYMHQALTGRPLPLSEPVRQFLTPKQTSEIERASQPPQPVQQGQITPAHVARENAFYVQARAELGANASVSQILQRAQQLKLQAPSTHTPSTPVPERFQTTAAKASRLSGPDRHAAATAIMLQLKNGQITQQQADKQIQRLNGGGGRKLIPMPERP